MNCRRYPVGMDAHQERACLAAGVEVRMPQAKPHRERLVAGIVALVCEHCGCTVAKPIDGKRKPCTFCGRMPGILRIEGSKWDPTAPVMGG